MAQRVRRSWLDQFTLRQDVDNPFVQVITSAQMIATVACDRGGLSRTQYDAAADVERQVRVIEDLARWLDDDVAAHARRCDEAIADRELDPETRARALSGGLTGAVRAHATLLDNCQTLLGLADGLLMINRPASRLRLLSAVETVRTAASVAHLTVSVNLPRITDVALYDRLAAKVDSFDTTLAEATRVAASLRSQVAVRQMFPSPRSPFS